MKRYFIIKKGSKIENKYKAYEKRVAYLCELFDEFTKMHNIEAVSFACTPYRLEIEPTEKDIELFGEMFKKGKPGNFKQNSELSKAWIAFCEENNANPPMKPYLIEYFDFSGFCFNSNIFRASEDCILAYAESNVVSVKSPYSCDFKEIKTSEFYSILEENNIEFD